jgi:CBS-domain-containing membrane protein
MGRIDPDHPIGGDMLDVLRGLARRGQLDNLTRRFGTVPILSLFAFINGCVSIGVMSLAALVARAPFVFPSLGPTAFLFFYTPRAPAASPRNTIIGHGIGALMGWLSLQAFGLADAGPAVTSDMTWQRVFAAALSLGLTSGFMVLLRAPHPPAGATTLIISLGVLHEPWQLGVLMLAVAMLTIQAFVINRAAGIPYPLWNPLPADAPAQPAPKS